MVTVAQRSEHPRQNTRTRYKKYVSPPLHIAVSSVALARMTHRAPLVDLNT